MEHDTNVVLYDVLIHIDCSSDYLHYDTDLDSDIVRS
jgi:hypothetical protein